MKAVIALLAIAALAGCMSVPTLTADQMANMPSGSTFCATYTGTGGTGKVSYAKLDQGGQGGNVVVDSNTCGMTIVNDAAVVAAARAAAEAAAKR